jgi:16S rRNA (adenine1518-N6/adenine1519-N6)-dimethyltransferase
VSAHSRDRRPPRPRPASPEKPRARKRFGQHFLERVWAERVVEAIGPREGDVFIEIGPGPGALTLPLAATGVTLRAIEIDRDLAAALAPRLPPNAEVVCTDFLALDAATLLGEHARVRIVGNLPYNLSSPILLRLLDLAKTTGRVVDATVMLQREVADRVTAEPGGGDYGPLAVVLGLHADRTRVLALPPGAFRPPPKVHSAVVRLAFRPPVVSVADEAFLEAMVRTLFQQRRKTVANALKPFAAARGLDGARAIAAVGLDGARRPETLQLSELSALAASLSGSV